MGIEPMYGALQRTRCPDVRLLETMHTYPDLRFLHFVRRRTTAVVTIS
jgi:hypothetical protein